MSRFVHGVMTKMTNIRRVCGQQRILDFWSNQPAKNNPHLRVPAQVREEGADVWATSQFTNFQ